MDCCMLCYFLFLSFLQLGSPEVSIHLPDGNNVGLGLSTYMVININPETCSLCLLKLEIVPPYFKISQSNQPMLNLHNAHVSYLGTNVFGSTLNISDTVPLSDNGNVLFDFGLVSIPEGSTDAGISLAVDVATKNIDIISFSSKLTLNIDYQLGSHYSVLKTTLQVVKPDNLQIQTFEPENPSVLYQSGDKASLIFSVKLPVTSLTPVYNISITCTVTEASPDFLTATTNPSSVSVLVVEEDGLKKITYVAKELNPGHVIVGRFDVFLHYTLQPDFLDLQMTVTSFSAPIESGGRQLDTISSDLLVPLRLKTPSLSFFWYPESTLVGERVHFTITVNLPALLTKYDIVITALFDIGSVGLQFDSVNHDDMVTNSKETINSVGSEIKIQGEAMFDKETSVNYNISGRVRSYAAAQLPKRLILTAGLSYHTKKGVKSVGVDVTGIVIVQHPALALTSDIKDVSYVTLGSTATFTVTVAHSSLSSTNAYKVVVISELLVPGILNCLSGDVTVAQLTGSKIQVTIPYLGIGEMLSYKVAAVPTSENVLESLLKLVSSLSYTSCQSDKCQRYGPEKYESSGLKLHSTDIGYYFQPKIVGIKDKFTLNLMPVSNTKICDYSATLFLPNNKISFNSMSVVTLSGDTVPTSYELKSTQNTVMDKLKFNISDFQNVQNIICYLSSTQDFPMVISVTVSSYFSFCNSALTVEETSYPSLNIKDVDVEISVRGLTEEVQTSTDMRYLVNIVLQNNLPLYNLQINILNNFVQFDTELLGSDKSAGYTLESVLDGVILKIPYLDTNTGIEIRGVTKDITMSTDTSSQWSYSFRSAPTSGKYYTATKNLPAIKVVKPRIASYIVNKNVDKLSVGDEFDMNIDIIASEIRIDYVVRIFIAACQQSPLFEVVKVYDLSMGTDVQLTAPFTKSIKEDTIVMWFQTNNVPNGVLNEDDIISVKVKFRSLFSVLQCQNSTFEMYHVVNYGLAPSFEIYQDTIYLQLVSPKLIVQFQQIPTTQFYDAKDIILFNLKIRHDEASSSPAYNISVDFVCAEFNMLVYTIVTPTPPNLQSDDVSLRFGVLPVGETFSAVIRTELKQNVAVSRKIVCGGKVDYMSSNNKEASYNYIYNGVFVSGNIALAGPTLSLWDFGVGQDQLYKYRILLTIPEGTLDTVTITLYVGMGIKIQSCVINDTTSDMKLDSNVAIASSGAEISLGSVYNKPDNMLTTLDSVIIEVSLTKTLPFAKLDKIYVALDSDSKEYAVSWSHDCSLQVNIISEEITVNVSGGDILQYTVIVSHDLMSEADCVDVTIYLELQNCDLEMSDKLEIRSENGIRQMVYINSGEDAATMRLDRATLGDSYFIPLTARVSVRIYPASMITMSAFLTYNTDPANKKDVGLKRKTKTSHSDVIFSAVPDITASLVTDLSNNKVAVGETVVIECEITLPKGQMDISVGVSVQGDETDNILMTGIDISEDFQHMSYTGIQTIKGLNRAFLMLTELLCPDPNDEERDTEEHRLNLQIPAVVYDSKDNVNGQHLDIMLLIGYSYTNKGMIENALFFTLDIVEPIVVMTWRLLDVKPNYLVIQLDYTHMAPPYINESTANAYHLETTLFPPLNCSGNKGVISGASVYLSQLLLGQSESLVLTCYASPQMYIGKYYPVSLQTQYSSYQTNGRLSQNRYDTPTIFSNSIPQFQLLIYSMDEGNKIKINEVADVSFNIKLPIGRLPSSNILWKSSSNLMMQFKSCKYQEQDLVKTTAVNEFGTITVIQEITNKQTDSVISCSASISTSASNYTSGTLTVTTSYGLNKDVVSQDLQITSPKLRTEFEMEDKQLVQGRDTIIAKYSVSHTKDSTGNAYNFLLNITTIGCLVSGDNRLKTVFDVLTLEDARSVSFGLDVATGLLPGSPVYISTTFSYTTFPSNTKYYKLLDHVSKPAIVMSVQFDVYICKTPQTKVEVGGVSFICVDVKLPVCKTNINISVSQPMAANRKLGEVADAVVITQKYPDTTSFTSRPVSHQISGSDIRISAINNIGKQEDVVNIKIPIHVLSEEKVYNKDKLDFKLTIKHETASGTSITKDLVSFEVVEPNITVSYDIVKSQPGEVYEYGSTIRIQYTISHRSGSLSPAYNIRLTPNNTATFVLDTGISVDVLAPEKEISGVLSLEIQEYLPFGELIEIVMDMKYISTPTDLGRGYQSTQSVGQVKIGYIKAGVTSSNYSITIGQPFTVFGTLQIPKAKGSVEITLGCTEHCEYVSGIISSDYEGYVSDNKITYSDLSGETVTSITLSIAVRIVNNKEVVEGDSIIVYLSVNGEVKDSVGIEVAGISVSVVPLFHTIQIVDAGNKLSESVRLNFSKKAYDITTSITCDHSISSITCDDVTNTCAVDLTVGSNVPPGVDITCITGIACSSASKFGREYTTESTIVLARSTAVECSNVNQQSFLSVGQKFYTYTQLNVTETQFTCHVAVLCPDNDVTPREYLKITKLEVINNLTSVSVKEDNLSVSPGCGRVTLSFTPTFPSNQVSYQAILIKSTLLLTELPSDGNDVVIKRIVTIGEKEIYLTNTVPICTPEFTLSSQLLNTSPYLKDGERLSYITTITNIGLCDLYQTYLSYIFVGGMINNTHDSVISPGGQITDEIHYNMTSRIGTIKPEVTANAASSDSTEYAAVISQTHQLGTVHLISPELHMRPIKPVALPYEEITVDIDIIVPYVVGDTGLVRVDWEAVGCTVEYFAMSYIGKEVSATSTTSTSTSLTYTIFKKTNNPILSDNDDRISLSFTVQVTQQGLSEYSLKFSVSLNEITKQVASPILVKTPDLTTSIKSGDLGGFIPGDVVMLTISVQHSDVSASSADDVVVDVILPSICTNAQTLQSDFQVTQINRTHFTASLPNMTLSDKQTISIQSEIPDTVDTDGKSFLYHTRLDYRSPVVGENSWKFSGNKETQLKTGQPEITITTDTVSTPGVSQLINSKVLLRKGTSDLTLQFVLSEALELQTLKFSDIGSYLSFPDSSGPKFINLTSGVVSNVLKSENTYTIDLGEVSCTNEGLDRDLNSFLVELKVYIIKTTDLKQHIQGSVNFGRGEDVTELSLDLVVPQLEIEFGCTVNNVPCVDFIDIFLKSEISYTIIIKHRANSTGAAYNIHVQLYVSLFNLEIKQTIATLGKLTTSGLGIKLTQDKLDKNEVIIWNTLFSVTDVSNEDCSTAVVSFYDLAPEEYAAIEMLPLQINYFTPQEVVDLPYSEMYTRGVLASTEHPYIYMCNTSCFVTSDGIELLALNSAVHSLIGLKIEAMYILYGISQNGAFVMSTSLNNWVTIPREIWSTATGDLVTPVAPPGDVASPGKRVTSSKGVTVIVLSNGVYNTKQQLLMSW